MADPELVTVRVACFIPDEWLVAPTEENAEYRGDARGFTGRAIGTGRSRVEQVAVADFRYDDVSAHARAGRSVERVVGPEGETERRSGRADTDDVVCHSVVWGEGVRFSLACEVANPLHDATQPVNWSFRVHVHRDGTVDVEGEHDGFPNVEIHAREDFGAWRSLYEHEYAAAGESPLSLAGDMDYDVDVTG